MIGGADYDWSSSQYQYPDNLGVHFLDNLKNTEEDLENELSLPDVNISSLNVEQKFAFNFGVCFIHNALVSGRSNTRLYIYFTDVYN